jgi:hypothetical protein
VRASRLATDGFVPLTLQKGEQFLRQAFQHLRDSSYPESHQVGKQLKRFCENFCKRCKPFWLIQEGDKDVMVMINVGNLSLKPRRVLWGEERFQAVQSIHEGKGHCGSFEKTRTKVAQRYWFPSLTTSVQQYVRHYDLCQKENAGKAPRCDCEMFPTPPTAPWFRVLVDLCGPFEPLGPLKYRYIAVAVDSLTNLVCGI